MNFKYFKKWNSYPVGVPRSGLGSRKSASRNFRLGLSNIVHFVRESLREETLAMLGKNYCRMSFAQTLFMQNSLLKLKENYVIYDIAK